MSSVPPVLKETLPDGRVVEFVSGSWAEASPDDPPNGLPMDITIAIDGEIITKRIFMTDDQMRAAFKDADDAGDSDGPGGDDA